VRTVGLSLLGVTAALALTACSNGDVGRRALANAPLEQRLAHADPAHGAGVFRRCAACHNLSEGGGDRDGPNLWGVLGKPVATNSARFSYTAALSRAGDLWTCARLDRWLTDPARFAPGTIMAFPGLSDGDDRADVIAFLARNGGAPASAACPRGLDRD
jgi:cytochrome c